MPVFSDRIRQSLISRKHQGLERSLQMVGAGNSANLLFEGKPYINFSNNDYLGLAADKELAIAWQRGLDLYGNGSGASPLVTGYSKAHHNLEVSLCDWLGYERAILFSSGFSANQALLFSLLHKDDLLLQDKRNHASLMEAGMLSPAKMKRFHHNDPAHLQTLLERSALVVTEGVFSMDGDLAPLAKIHAVTRGGSWLVVDDAHGIGVLGKEGRGSCHFAGIQPEVLIVTFGKALGLSGAAIMCNKETGDYLTQFARHHVYSTAIPPSQAFALTHAVHMVRNQAWRREKLQELQEEYKQCFSSFEGYVDTPTPIKPLLLGESQLSVKVADSVRQSGYWLTAIRPPTVAKNSARLRVTLSVNHSVQQVRELANIVETAMEKEY
ncbi:8-amino-7-oxononanoate synthase [Vibrio sp. Isolate25]|uniref:8-amino-7-oxononanoate synthase n=1 Tax=Vibrio sp. Isolate25 TaxID=2908535 RepID=UPI001EFE70D5|nr:8-amino-7-oxononanoate synthase [Vibrio sp. Isolate25]MCG9596816.1 8-amino-7-oxononanoate synthase [Vibrio sp. Isolate25]